MMAVTTVDRVIIIMVMMEKVITLAELMKTVTVARGAISLGAVVKKLSALTPVFYIV